MDNFWIGFFAGIAAGQLIVFGLVRLNAMDSIKLWSRRARRWSVDLFWRGFEMLLNYLDELLALRRAREAGDLGSPNLIS
jgi:hypothetical protein